jgi:Gpi18-like mannosyltransferase
LIHPFKDKKILFVLLIVALFIVEVFFAMWTEGQYDMNIWFQTGVWMNRGINIYMPDNHIGYPPLWALWCLVAQYSYGFFGNNMEVWRFTIKLPLILAQFGLAFAIGKFAQKRFDQKTGRKIFLFALTWIFFIYIGALWGQLNMLSALLTFLAFYAVTSKRFTIGALLLGIAVTLKIYPLIVLPAFLAYVLKNQGKKETGKFTLYTLTLPIVFTLGVFAVYQWDIGFFLRTIFYWTPVFETNPVLIQGGCMNIWSFMNLLNVDISQVWLLRFIWIPIVGAAAIYWFKKPKMSDADLNLALISFYVLFMVSYSWVPEQMFLDPLPFIFLQIFAYRAKKIYFYGLLAVQVLVFAFSAFNWGPFIFEPLLKRFSPELLASIQFLDPSNPLIWTIREILGLVVSVSLIAFLVGLAKPAVFERIQKKVSKTFAQVLGKRGFAS